MSDPRASAIVTPSFRGDFARCALLIDSIERHVPPEVPHYLVVDRRDLPLFRPLSQRRTKLLIVEEVIPRWIKRIPGVRRFWWSFRSRPIKNWILQQIVKLSVPRAAAEETLFYVDSDVFFVRDFVPASLFRDGKPPLFCETGRAGVAAFNDQWHQVASALLGLPVEPVYDTIFVGNIVCWRRSTELAMLEHVERITGMHWARAVARTARFSEYVLYGLYATRVLGAAALQYPDSTDRTLCHWDTRPLSPEELERSRDAVAPPKVAVMISSKSRTDVETIRRTFGY